MNTVYTVSAWLILLAGIIWLGVIIMPDKDRTSIKMSGHEFYERYDRLLIHSKSCPCKRGSDE